MFTGTMIDDLIKTVEKTEEAQWRASALPLDPAEAYLAEAYPVVSVYPWRRARLEPVIIGVA